MAARMMPFAPAQSVLTEIDVSKPQALRVVRTLTLDGGYVAARLVGGSVQDRRHRSGADRASVRAAQERHEGRARRGRQAQPRRRRLVPRRELAAVVPGQASGSKATKKRALVQCRHVRTAGRILGPRDADRADRRSREGDRAHRLGRGDDGRADRLRLAGEPVRGDRALGRPPDARQADAGEGRRQDHDPQVRHLEPCAHAVPGQRRGVRLPAQPVVALRVQRRPARRQHRAARVVGPPAASRSRS